MVQRCILLTGFEPFGGDSTNSSLEVALRLDRTSVGEFTVISHVLPCVFGQCFDALSAQMGEHRPEWVVCLGQAARAQITPEKVAINLDDARIPDNAGNQPIDTAILKDGPTAYWSRLPVRAIANSLLARNIPSAASYSAGAFVCNHLFYRLMHQLRHTRVGGGFIHVPRLDPDVPGVSIDLLVRGIGVALEVIVAKGPSDWK